MKPRILFLCTGNSCRSQMAEGLLRTLADDRFEACSAGSNPSGYVHPKAIEVMQEIGIDISHAKSKSMQNYLRTRGSIPDIVISVCDSAAKSCPLFPADVEHHHVPFEDPAFATGTEDQKLQCFREIRDEIRSYLEHAVNTGSWEKEL